MKKNAFTLVELIVAISIMSIVLVLAIPSIGAISERNARKRYENYGETLVSSGKLYTDSNAIDMFGYESDGCYDIYFDALEEKKLAKDIDYKDITCADGTTKKTYVKVRKLDGEIKYQLSMVCRDEKGEVVYDDLIDSSDILCDGRAPHTGPEITVSPEKQEAYLSEDETYKVSIKIHDDDGLLENNEVEYSWCKDASCTNVISTTKLRYENKRDADIKTVNKKIARPKGDGVYYLRVKSVKVVDIFNNATTYEKIFGPYRFDTTPPKVTIKAYRRSATGKNEGSEVATASIGARKVIKDKTSTNYLISYKEGTMAYDTLKNLYNKKWANKANYPYGLYYIIEYDDNVVSGIAGSGVVKEAWKYNKSGSPTKTKDGGGSSSNNISGKGTIKEYLEADGYRNGVVTVTDKAGNYVKVELETYLDKTTPTIEGKVYKKASGDSKKDNNVVASATANNTTGDANILTFNSSVNGWLNKANYKTGIYYEFKVTDNLGLDNGKWYYNPDGKKSSDTPTVNNFNGPNTDTFDKVKNKTTHHTLEADGYRKGKYTVIDMAGNPITINTTAPIDKTDPTCTNEGGSATWLNTLTSEKSRTITGKCSDGMSGCTNGSANGRTYKDGNVSWTITENTNSTTVSPGTVYDVAGNSTKCEGDRTVKIDMTRPTVSLKVYKKTASDTKANNTSIASTTVNNTTATASIVGTNYTSNVSGWLNRANYPNGVYYEFTSSDNFGLNEGTWSYNGDGLTANNASVNNLTGKNSDNFNGNKGAIAKSHTFEKDGYRKGKYTVYDIAGNYVVIDVTAPIDKTDPSCASSGGSSTWINLNSNPKSRTITGTCSDGMSGCTNGSANGRTYRDGNVLWTITADTNSTTVSPGTVYDVAGNSTSCPSNQTVKIDLHAPTCSTKASPEGWTKKNVTVSGTCSDSGAAASGCVSNATPALVDYDVNGNVSPSSNVADNAGNVGICSGTLVQRDTKGPSQPSYELRKVNNTGVEYQKNTWTNTNVYQRLSSTDDGIGVSDTGWQYSFNDSTWHNFPSSDGDFSFGNVTGVNYKIYDSAMKFRIDDNYNKKIYIRVKDKLGNASSSTHYTVKIDKIPPNCTSSGGSGSWTKTSRTLVGTCSDSGASVSGCVDKTVANRTYSNGNVSWLINWEGNYENLSPGTVYDEAGNSTPCPSNQTVKIDQTAPKCSIKKTVTGDTAGVDYTVSCSDSASGMKSGKAECAGSSHKTSSNKYNLKKTTDHYAYDAVGNKSVACTVTVTAQNQKKTCTTCKTCNTSTCLARSECHERRVCPTWFGGQLANASCIATYQNKAACTNVGGSFSGSNANSPGQCTIAAETEKYSASDCSCTSWKQQTDCSACKGCSVWSDKWVNDSTCTSNTYSKQCQTVYN